MEPLPLTQTHGVPGEAVLGSWRGLGVTYPVCTLHGAMLRVSADQPWYRCPTCNIGVEDTTRARRQAVLAIMLKDRPMEGINPFSAERRRGVQIRQEILDLDSDLQD